MQGKYPITELEQLVKGSDNHHVERYASSEPDENDRERPGPLDRTRHDGERCLSPERTLECDGWCREENKTSGMTTFDHPDVVRWAFNYSSTPPYLLPWFP